MPARNGTGPTGQGSLTGRGLGPCGKGMAFGRGCGKGMAFGRGCGKSFGRGFWNENPLSDEEMVKILKAQKNSIEEELKELEK